MVDSRGQLLTDALLREAIGPALVAHGFRRRSRGRVRTWIRDHPLGQDVIGFPALGARLAEALGAPSWAFSVCAGLYFSEAHADWTGAPTQALPSLGCCDARLMLENVRAERRPGRPPRADLWCHDPRFREDTIADLSRAVHEAAQWASSLHDVEQVLARFEAVEEQWFGVGALRETYGGTLASPYRTRVIVALARAASQSARADRALARCEEMHGHVPFVRETLRTWRRLLSAAGPE